MCSDLPPLSPFDSWTLVLGRGGGVVDDTMTPLLLVMSLTSTRSGRGHGCGDPAQPCEPPLPLMHDGTTGATRRVY